MKAKRVFFTAAAILLAVFLVTLATCDLDIPGLGKDKDVEYTDWEFVELPDGTAQLTVWLDGSTPVPVQTNTRALNLGIAKRSHDFFEAIFITGSTVARTNWEIGQAAGIRGVTRGVAYDSVNPTPGAGGSSMLLVGRKAGTGMGTLLGVGVMTHIDRATISGAAVTPTTKNVTFTVSALSTRVGYDFSVEEDLIADTWFTGAVAGTLAAAHPNYVIRDTFYTNARDYTGTVDFANTLIGTATFKNDATYTMFGLPKPSTVAAANVIEAIYTIGGLQLAGTEPDLVGTSYAGSPTNLAESLFVADCSPEPNFQILERLAIYQTMGQTYDVIEADLDTATTVALTTAAAANYAAGAPFDDTIDLAFKLDKNSGGAFAFTFQVPVYALAVTTAGAAKPSTNGGTEAIKWYIRPAHGQPQFLLDNGYSSGGAVLMGVGVGSLDWLEIIVKGFGFSN